MIGVDGSEAGADESKWAVRQAFEHLASDRPLVVVLDDLQWAEPPFLDLVDHLADAVTDAPVLLLCMARPELLDARPSWGGGKLNSTTILLEPLDPARSDELVAQLLGRRVVPDELRVRVAAAAAGNPLFAEELLAYLRERGHITVTKEAVAVRSDLDEVELPPTIRALIAARLDQLPDEERGVLERGAVEGQVFHAAAVTALSDRSSTCSTEFQRLVRKQVIKPDAAVLPGEDAFRFRHLLIRDATYDGIPKQRRAEWHRRFAQWLETTVGQRVTEYEAILAYHYSAAYRYLVELGADDAESLRDRAAALLRRSADRSLTQGDLPNAAVVLEQLVGVLPPSHSQRVVALADRGRALRDLGQNQQADEVAREAVSEALDADPEIAMYAQVSALRIAADLGRVASFESMLGQVKRLAQHAEDAGWHSVASMAWCGVAEAATDLHRSDETVSAAQRARAHADAARVPWLAADANKLEAFGLLEGSEPIDAAIERLDVLFPERLQDRPVMMRRCLFVGMLRATQGQIDTALRLLEQGARIRAELGVGQRGDEAWFRGFGYFEAGQPADAVPHLVEAASGAIQAGDRSHGSTQAALAAHALAQVGEHDNVERFVGMAREWSSPDDRSTQMLWRGALARVRAASGDNADAEQLAREAVELAEGTSYASAIGRALIDLAWVSLRIGKPEQAAAPARRAVVLLSHRGAIPMRDLAQTLLDETQRPVTP